MMSDACYRILPGTTMISGRVHYLVQRQDGFRFYLDDAFCQILDANTGLISSDELIKSGITQSEVIKIRELLINVGLMETDQS